MPNLHWTEHRDAPVPWAEARTGPLLLAAYGVEDRCFWELVAGDRRGRIITEGTATSLAAAQAAAEAAAASLMAAAPGGRSSLPPPPADPGSVPAQGRRRRSPQLRQHARSPRR